MLTNGHVRFGGRPAETHTVKTMQGAAGRPYTEHHTGGETLCVCDQGHLLQPDRGVLDGPAHEALPCGSSLR